jgi:deoxyribodipyrimidine photo-lyase
MNMAHVVLFTRDLRVHDHPALTAAVRAGGDVVPLFVQDPKLLGRSPNRDRFLMGSLVDLDRSLQRRGGRLAIRGGDPVREALAIAREVGASSVHVTGDVTGYAQRREQDLLEALRPDGIELHVHPGNAVVEPGEVRPVGKDMYSVFTPFHRAWAVAPRRGGLPAPARVTLPAALEIGPRPDLDETRPDSIDLPPGGESAGRRHLDKYLASDARRYEELRNDLAADGTSRMSPYIRFGCVSVNEIAARAAAGGADELVRQLAWRDFFGQLLSNDPALQWRDFRSAPADVPSLPRHAPILLHRWAEGRTGIPLVDAGMRQLQREGWIHNRARMVVANFLTRRLGIPWQQGAGVFMRLLVDGDPANNSGGWQWAAGTGTDPRRSRSFNPVRQAERFDPSGVYIKRYVRELRDVEVPLLFAPWKQPAILHRTGYPEPVLELPANVGRDGPGTTPSRAAVSVRPTGQASLPV